MDKKRLTWFILARLVVVSLFLASTIILNVRQPESFEQQALSSFINLIIVTYMISILSLLVLKLSTRHIRTTTYLQILWDLIFVTLLLLMTGGISSPFSFLYLLSIINASVLLARRQAFYTASLCAILYGATVDLLYYEIIRPINVSYVPAYQYDSRYIVYIIFLNIVSFYFVAFLTGTLAERAVRSENALQEKVVDYEELDHLNSSIVANLSSGLLMIDNDGYIHVFNRFAEVLTGIQHTMAEGKTLIEIMPDLHAIISRSGPVARGEIEYQTPQGENKTLGFQSAPLNDKDNEKAGTIINFQDVTHVKQIECELLKADRLAAVGELSARIAHEIRNPLASISASVQLLVQGAGVSEQDRKLLDIVDRETDRLNGLITDFLAYARPAQPNKSFMHLRPFIEELALLLATDQRFHNVVIHNNCPEELVVHADFDQFRQVMWNLLLNSAEAITEQGEVVIDGGLESSWPLNRGDGEQVKITITDNGSGMEKETVARVFEPFFSTKNGGSGLGLAMVYRIIDAHKGVILVDSTRCKGTVFTIYLPVPPVLPEQA